MDQWRPGGDGAPPRAAHVCDVVRVAAKGHRRVSRTCATARAAVHAVVADLPVSVTLAFHEAQRHNRFDLVEAFRDGDAFALTYYPSGEGFDYSGDPTTFGAVLDEMIAVAGEKPLLIVENGWATSDLLGSDEARQAAYINHVYDALAVRRGAFDRHIFYALHDNRPADCATSARALLAPDIDPATLGDGLNRFEAYLCTLGLRAADGTPKAGWDAFVTATRAYLAER